MAPFRAKDGHELRARTTEEMRRQVLPLPDLSHQPGHPQYLVNMVKLAPDKEHFRDTIFWNIFRNSILFDTIETANQFR